ncbi:MAG: hypothetical protein K0Q99_2058 [Clostridia bacterium]|jgi:hypothetical protein|nr:hypothetical protein [Clostridia bacterium]
MPFCPFFCPYMNQQNDENAIDDDLEFRSPNGFGPPFGPPSGPPSGGQSGPPSGPPPSKAPTLKSTGSGPSIKAVDPGAIRPCRFQFVYIWPSYGRPFWAWLTFVGRRSVAGYRWNGYSWRYFGMDLRQINNFECY